MANPVAFTKKAALFPLRKSQSRLRLSLVISSPCVSSPPSSGEVLLAPLGPGPPPHPSRFSRAPRESPGVHRDASGTPPRPPARRVGCRRASPSRWTLKTFDFCRCDCHRFDDRLRCVKEIRVSKRRQSRERQDTRELVACALSAVTIGFAINNKSKIKSLRTELRVHSSRAPLHYIEQRRHPSDVFSRLKSSKSTFTNPVVGVITVFEQCSKLPTLSSFFVEQEYKQSYKQSQSITENENENEGNKY